MKKYNLILLSVIFLLFAITYVSAIPPTQTNVNTNVGLQIFYPSFDTLKQGQDFHFHVHVSNISTGYELLSNQTDCYLELYNSSGFHILDTIMEKEANSSEHNYIIGGGNFSSNGFYSWKIYCEDTWGGSAQSDFEVTPTGYSASTGTAIFQFGVLFIILVFLVVAIYSFISSEQLWTKTASLGIIYLILIAISFISWIMASDFLTTSTFVINFLRIIFLTLIIGFFPFLIGLFAYGVYMMLQIQEIKKLQDQGYSLEEATEIVAKRRKR